VPGGTIAQLALDVGLEATEVRVGLGGSEPRRHRRRARPRRYAVARTSTARAGLDRRTAGAIRRVLGAARAEHSRQQEAGRPKPGALRTRAAEAAVAKWSPKVASPMGEDHGALLSRPASIGTGAWPRRTSQ